MNKIIVDTSVFIDYFRRIDKEQSLLIQLAKQEADIVTSILTHTELYSGKSVWERKQVKADIDKLFVHIELIYVNKTISLKAGELRAKSDLDLVDAIIASTAILNDFTVATLNIKDFNKVAGLKLY